MIFILCLNWNGENLLDDLLTSLLLNLNGLEYQIHIRDNGSKDNSIKIMEKYPVHIHHISHNRDSFSNGINYLYENISANDEDYILLLNNDIKFITTDNIKNMLDLQKKQKAGMIGAKLIYSNSIISHYGIIFSKKYNNLPWNFKSGEQQSEYDKHNRRFQAVTAACCLFKSHIFNEVNGLCRDLNWAFEDVDLSLKISINKNLPIICYGKSQIEHKTSESLKKNPVNKLFMQQNVKIFREKWDSKYKIDHDLYLNDKNYNII